MNVEGIYVPLTQGRSCVVSAEDAEWALAQSWCVTNGYPARGVWTPRRRVLYMHREIAVRAGLLTDYDGDSRLTDHINRDPFDNRRENLRAVTHPENNCNRAAWGASGILGVYQRPNGLWDAEIRRNGERRRKRGFTSPEEATAWRDEQREAMGARI